MKAGFWFLVFLLACGLLWYDNATYKVTAARYYTVSGEVPGERLRICSDAECDMIDFTLTKGWSHTFKTECQAFDAKNTCSQLRVGQRLRMDYREATRYLSKDQTVLVVTEERD